MTTKPRSPAARDAAKCSCGLSDATVAHLVELDGRYNANNDAGALCLLLTQSRDVYRQSVGRVDIGGHDHGALEDPLTLAPAVNAQLCVYAKARAGDKDFTNEDPSCLKVSSHS